MEVSLKSTEETIDAVRKALGLDKRRVMEAVEGLKKWQRTQPHLPTPQDDDDLRLEWLLIRCKNNMEKTKQTLDLYYTLKTTVPEFFTGWDIKKPWFENTLKYWLVVPMPELTPDLDRVIYMGITTKDLGEDFKIEDTYKFIFMANEIRMVEDYYLRDIIIFDLKHISMKYVTKLTLPLIKKLETCSQKGYSCRIRAIHLVNVPNYVHVSINWAKSVLSKKFADIIQVYENDFTELYKQIPKRFLPNELGGEVGSLDEFQKVWKKKILNSADWLEVRGKLKSDESKRPTGRMTASDLFGFEGSFRTLSVD